MVDLTSTERYRRYMSKAENCKKVYTGRAVKRIIDKKIRLTQNKVALMDIFKDIKKNFLKSLNKTDKPKFDQEVKVINGLAVYLCSLCEVSCTEFPDSSFEEGSLELGHVLRANRQIHHSTKASYVNILNKHPVYAQQLIAVVLNLDDESLDEIK
ncbi:hypothetical protein BD770DRAFT_456896 [Pilaira anomala]|nr:hypothetical protein BD770DRAFT_456896 [Pilaira anomala]